jgi:hypothetical protein
VSDIPMSTTAKILGILILLIVGGAVAFLATWEMPPPSKKVEKVIPNDKVLR